MLFVPALQAITVHKSQGSEYPVVILPVTRQFGNFVSRRLLYTALTRARRYAFLVGSRDCIEAAIGRTADQQRNSNLCSRLKWEWDTRVAHTNDVGLLEVCHR